MMIHHIEHSTGIAGRVERLRMENRHVDVLWSSPDKTATITLHVGPQGWSIEFRVDDAGDSAGVQKPGS